MSLQKPIVVVGSINTDLVAVTRHIPAVGETVIGSDFQIHPGGKGANQAVAVARLGYPVRIIGRLGRDTFGAELRTYLEKAGVDIAGVSTTDGVSGVAVIVVSERGENSIVVTPGANSKVTPEDIDTNIAILRSAGMVLAQLEIPLETIEYLARVCARENLPLVLDPAPAMDLPATLFQHIAWFTPNQTEAAFYLRGQYAESDPPSAAEIADLFFSKRLPRSGLKDGCPRNIPGNSGWHRCAGFRLRGQSHRHDCGWRCFQRWLCHRPHVGEISARQRRFRRSGRRHFGDTHGSAALDAHHG